jgi:hypothetical protein
MTETQGIRFRATSRDVIGFVDPRAIMGSPGEDRGPDWVPPHANPDDWWCVGHTPEGHEIRRPRGRR